MLIQNHSRGDGKADYIWLSRRGAATAYINIIDQNLANFMPLNDQKPIANGIRAKCRDVRFADVK